MHTQGCLYGTTHAIRSNRANPGYVENCVGLLNVNITWVGREVRRFLLQPVAVVTVKTQGLRGTWHDNRPGGIIAYNESFEH